MRQEGLAFVRRTRISWAAGALATTGLFSACLVTSKVDYDEDFIPSEVSRAEPRLGEFTSVPPEPETCKDQQGDLMRFGIQVTDLNREEVLQVQYVVNREYYSGYTIKPTGERDRGEVAFCVPKSKLLQSCNLVEALVSSEFNRDTTNRPYDAPNKDLSSVHWWVILDPTDDPTASALDCPEDVPNAGEL